MKLSNGYIMPDSNESILRGTADADVHESGSGLGQPRYQVARVQESESLRDDPLRVISFFSRRRGFFALNLPVQHVRAVVGGIIPEIKMVIVERIALIPVAFLAARLYLPVMRDYCLLVELLLGFA
jgi:hypothetical protein